MGSGEYRHFNHETRKTKKYRDENTYYLTHILHPDLGRTNYNYRKSTKKYHSSHLKEITRTDTSGKHLFGFFDLDIPFFHEKSKSICITANDGRTVHYDFSYQRINFGDPITKRLEKVTRPEGPDITY